MAKKEQKLKKKKLSGFLSMFISRVDEEENLDLIDDGPDTDYYPETDLFDSPDSEYPSYDEEFYPEEENWNNDTADFPQENYDEQYEPFSEEEDIENVSKLTWSDGAPVVEELPEEEPADFQEDSGDEYEYADLPEEMELQDESGNPSARSSGRTRIFRPSTNRSDEEHEGNEFLSEEEMAAYLESRDVLTPSEKETEEESPETEGFFDDIFDDDTVPERKTSGKTRIFGNSAVRVNVAETETSRAVHAAARKNREAEAEKKHEQYVKRQKRIKRRKEFFRDSALTVAFIIFVVVAVIIAAYFTFQLSDVVITGNDQYSADYIMKLSSLEYGQNVFFMDLQKAKANIVADPYLQVNEITYVFPSRVHIDIVERKEVAGIIGLDYNIVIDKNGYVLSMSNGTDLSSLLQVTGISVAGFKLGERIGEGSDFSTSTLISIIEKLEEYDLLGRIKSVDLTTPLAITMFTGTGFKIFLGQPTDLETKFASLSALLPRFDASGIATGTIYLSAKGGTVYSPPVTSNLLVTGNLEETENENNEESESRGNEEETLMTDPETGEQIVLTPTPLPATPTPLPLQPGGGDEFQG